MGEKVALAIEALQVPKVTEQTEESEMMAGEAAEHLLNPATIHHLSC